MSNSILTLKKIYRLIPKDSKKKLGNLASLSLASTFLEILGVALIVPLVYLISDKNFLISKIPFDFAKSDNFPIIFFGLIISLFVIKNILLILFLNKNSKIIFSVGNEISTKIYRLFLYKKYEFFKGKDTSIFIRNVIQDVNVFMINIVIPIVTISIEILIIIGSSIILIITEPYFFILIFSVGLCSGIIYFKKFQNRLSIIGQEMLDASAKRIKLSRQGFDGIKDIIINQTQNKFYVIFKNYSSKFFNSMQKKYLASALPRFLIEIVFISTFGLFVSYMIIRGDELREIFSVLGIYSAIAFRLMPSFIKIYSEFSNLKFSLPVIKDLEDILLSNNSKNEINNFEIKKNKINFINKVKFEQVEYKHINSKKEIFRNLNFDISFGEKIGIIGESGSGKTTFVDLLTGILSPDKGKITIDDNDLSKINPEWFNIVGYMSQKFYIIDGTIRENILFGNNNFNDKDLDQVLEIVQLKDFVNNLDKKLETIVDENGNNFSGGQLQRIVLARTLIKRPEILILDECTSALDKDNETKLLKEIQCSNFIKTIVIISHRKDVLSFCDKIFKIENGKFFKQ